jgi:hypothetical protein
MSSTTDYIADHIDRIDRRHGGKESLILNSKWRIASALEMFGSDLNLNGSLSPEQLRKVDAYIAKFKASPAGREAISQYQRRAG